MELFIEFVGARWYLFTLVILLMFLLMNHERRRGGPSISPAQLTMLVNQHEGVVVDLRETADFRQGHIVDSISVPAAKFAERIAELECVIVTSRSCWSASTGSRRPTRRRH
jgi:hypothetical protein